MGKILYHGTIADFSKVTLDHAKSRKDFGIGFYTTDSLQHASAIAKKSVAYGYGTGYIYSFKVDMAEIKENLAVKEFRGNSGAWLEYITYNRLLNPSAIDYDIVIGPTADARTQRILTQECLSCLSDQGKLILPDHKEKELLHTLTQTGLSQKLGVQYCFKSYKAIDYLNAHFLERRGL